MYGRMLVLVSISMAYKYGNKWLAVYKDKLVLFARFIHTHTQNAHARAHTHNTDAHAHLHTHTRVHAHKRATILGKS